MTTKNRKRQSPSPLDDPEVSKKRRNRFYEAELSRLNIELIKLQEHVKREGRRIVVLFEGRDAAGKGGVIKRITEPLNPRVCRVVALGTPTERQKTQWYFQRYVAELPAAGEIVLFDRSWYNRAGVERVMGFCSDAEYWDFLRSVPDFERMLVRSGIVLIKYWFSVSNEVQESRFRDRAKDPTKRWKLSPMDLQSRDKWQAYSLAKDRMLSHTDIHGARWHIVNSDNKKRARLNCISHLLSLLPHDEPVPDEIDLTPRALEARGPKYERPPLSQQNYVPEIY
ncbi:MAG: polyphosphate kinase 2 [Proteobacteria bacterium]|jgi:polyphosphate kinase 2|nr:polyphosphate kinase 2 [Pseudomonadota bacterium]MDA1300770.1 polyphosphate kinase 2 [Pseudomonadota bacterium]